MTTKSQFNGHFATFDENRSTFVGNDGESFAFKFVNKENVGDEEISFLLSREAAEFVAQALYTQLGNLPDDTVAFS